MRRTIADLDLTYYLPCTVRGRTIAYLGVSRTADGDYLSSVDVELLITLAGYVGIAIENAALYRSLQRKVEEYERLKEFSENIVESINVGILAADLEDRVESWNTPDRAVERRAARSRPGPQVGRTVPRRIWPWQFERVRGQTGIHHIYKFVLKPVSAPEPPAALPALPAIPTGTPTDLATAAGPGAHLSRRAFPGGHRKYRHRPAGRPRNSSRSAG